MRSFYSRFPLWTIAWLLAVTGLLLKTTPLQAQFGPQQVISTEVDVVLSVYAVDLDSDDDQDVLYASLNSSRIAWHENTDGQGNFGPQQVITAEADYVWSVFPVDLDGDGDQDVLGPSWNKISWYENIDGLGNFGPPQVITTEASGVHSVYAADLDGDGDQDVLSGSFSFVSWFENLGRAVNVTPPEFPSDLPEGYRLSSAYPNPVGSSRSGSEHIGHEASARLELVLARPEQVSVMVYTMQGRRVAHWKEGTLSAHQTHIIRFSSGVLPAGSYLVQVIGEHFTATRQVVLVQ